MLHMWHLDIFVSAPPLSRSSWGPATGSRVSARARLTLHMDRTFSKAPSYLALWWHVPSPDNQNQMALGTLLNDMWQPGWEGSLEENGYTHIYGWVLLLSFWNYHHTVNQLCSNIKGFPGEASGKEPACQCRKHKRYGFDPWVGRSPGEGHGNSLQDSCLENPMNRGAWRATVHGVTELDTTETTQHSCIL